MRTLLFLAAATLLSAADFKEFNRTVPLAANGQFSLDTYKGSIHVTAWDQPQVEIRARIVADPSSLIAEPVEDVEIRVDNTANSVRVKTDYRHNWTWFEGSLPDVHYTIRVPRSAALSIKDYKSDSEISGVDGDVEFETYKGTAHLTGLRRALRLNTYKGDIRAAFSSFTAASRIETYKGTIDLSLPGSSAFELNARLERRASLDCDFVRNIRFARRNRDLRSAVNGGGAELRVTSYRGSIRLRSVS